MEVSEDGSVEKDTDSQASHVPRMISTLAECCR